MFAVVKIGSFQYKVTQGDMIEVNHVKGQEGEELVLDQVLMVADDKKVEVGKPYCDKAKVTAKIVKQLKGEKVISLKYRLRKNSATKVGLRKRKTALSIEKIAA